MTVVRKGAWFGWGVSLAVGLSALGQACRPRTQESGKSFESASAAGDETAKEEALRASFRAKDFTSDCPAGRVCATVLQLNDVYEINAIAGGTAGGLDRVAAFRRLLAENQKAGPVISAMAGDFLYPSALGTIKENGRPWTGKQMTSVLKTTGLDFVMFGNHEFDLDGADFFDRLEETGTPDNPQFERCDVGGATSLTGANLGLASAEDAVRWEKAEARAQTLARHAKASKLSRGNTTCAGAACGGLKLAAADDACNPDGYVAGRQAPKCFSWISSNVFRGDGKARDAKTVDTKAEKPFTVQGKPMPKARLISFENAGRTFNVGLMGLTIIKNQKDYQQFADVQATAKLYAGQLKAGLDGMPKADAVLAITHLNRKDDIELLKKVPEIDYTIGGHDHKTSFDCVEGAGAKRCVAKADANARSVYVHRLIFDPKAKTAAERLAIKSELFQIDPTIPSDPKVAALIDCWFGKADQALAKASGGGGMSLRTPIAKVAGEGLDGGEESIRNKKGSNLTVFISKAMFDAANAERADKPPVNFAFISGGSIRVDDVVGPGVVTYFDAIRIFPSTHKFVNATIKLKDFAKIFRRLYAEVPPGAGATFHIYPKIAASDAEPSTITEATMLQDMMTASGIQDPNATILIHSTDYLLRLNDNLTDAEKALFTLTDETFAKPDTRALLVQSLQTTYPL